RDPDGHRSRQRARAWSDGQHRSVPRDGRGAGVGARGVELSHSGAPRSGEPGIQSNTPTVRFVVLDSGLAPSARPGMTVCSLPQLLRRQPRAFGQRCKLHPYDLAVDLHAPGKRAEAAIDAGDDVLAPDRAGILKDAVTDQLRMLDEIRRR